MSMTKLTDFSVDPIQILLKPPETPPHKTTEKQRVLFCACIPKEMCIGFAFKP